MRSGSAPGPNGVSWAAYRDQLDQHIATLTTRLADGTWQPGPCRPAALDVGDKTISITIPNVEDRIVHRAMRACIEPILDSAAYPEWMFGWRPRRGRVDALDYASRYLATDPSRWVADVDVAAATAGMRLESAVDALARWINDGSFLQLARRALAALPEPLAPGSGLTPMLTNLRLLPVDECLVDLPIIRVTDNYAVFTATHAEAEAAFVRVTDALSAAGLRANARKSKVWQPNPEDLFLAG